MALYLSSATGGGSVGQPMGRPRLFSSARTSLILAFARRACCPAATCGSGVGVGDGVELAAPVVVVVVEPVVLLAEPAFVALFVVAAFVVVAALAAVVDAAGMGVGAGCVLT